MAPFKAIASIDDGVQICLRAVEQFQNTHIDMPNLVGCRRTYTDGGFGRMNALPRSPPTSRAWPHGPGDGQLSIGSTEKQK